MSMLRPKLVLDHVSEITPSLLAEHGLGACCWISITH